MKKYTLIKEEYLADYKEYGSYYVHNKTGARVVIIKNNDSNRAFGIAFKTIPEDSTGVFHILEHSVLCGSKKYPIKDPFATLLQTSLYTYLNAFTTSDMTIFPLSSLNLQDYKNLTDVYLDAVFNPLFLEKKEIFLQEGWRYELNKDNELSVNGVVYNEMIGATSSTDYYIEKKNMEYLFKHNCYSFESGGSPSDIPNLTYEKFIETYKKNYHPSNSYIFLYGDIDVTERLEYLDREYLSKYDKIVFNKKFESNLEYIQEEVELPYDSSNGEEGYIFTLGIAISNAYDIEKCNMLKYIVTDLGSDNNSLTRTMLDNNICEYFEVQCILDIFEPTILFVGRGAKKESKDAFYNTIEKKLKDIVRNGINIDNYKSILRRDNFYIRENRYNKYSKGLQYFYQTLSTLSLDDKSPFDNFHCLESNQKILNNLESGMFEKFINDDILNNKHRVKISFKPNKNYRKKENELFKNKLDSMLESWATNDLENLKNQNENFNNYLKTPDSAINLKKMPKLTLSDIELTPVKTNLEKINDKLYFSSYDTNGIVYKKYLFKLDKFNKEELHYIRLFSYICMLLNTKKYTYQELSKLDKYYSNGVITNVKIYNKDDKSSIYFVVSMAYLDNDFSYVNDYVHSFLFDSLYDDKNRLKQLIDEEYDYMKDCILSDGNAFACRRALSYTCKDDYYRETMFGISFFDFLKKLRKNFDTLYPTIKSVLTEIPSKIFVKDKVLVHYTGTEQELEQEKDSINEFINNLNDTYVSNKKLRFRPCVKNEAFIINSKVNYVAVGGSYESKYNVEYMLLDNYISMNYLWNEVRVKGGAYGVDFNIDTDSISMSSYRDPNIRETLETFKNVSNIVENLDMTEEELVHAKISTIGANDDHAHNYNLSNKALTSFLSGINYEKKCENRKKIIDVNVESLKEAYKLVLEALNKNAYCVIGNKENITNNKDMFKKIKKLF